MAKPPLNGVAETEYTKSHLRGLSSLLKNTSLSRRRQPTHCVHWFIPACTVSRTSHAWRVRAANGKAKVGGFALRAISAIPRVRTYHTKKPSRFVHALPARPHIKVGIDRFAKRTRPASPRQGIVNRASALTG